MTTGRELIGRVPAGQDPEAYDRVRRRVLWAMPAGLYVVGSRSAALDEEPRTANLMTCNWAMQVCIDPKLVAVSIDSGAVTCRLIDEGGVFTVCLLARDDRAMVRRFVKPVTEQSRDPAGRLAVMSGEPVFEAPSGAPVLARAVAWLDCEVSESSDLGSHTLFVGEVTAAAVRPDAGLDAILRMEDTRMSYGG